MTPEEEFVGECGKIILAHVACCLPDFEDDICLHCTFNAFNWDEEE